MKVTIIGGGVIGLCSAYYLCKDGHEVTIIEKGNFGEGCSYGNMGYVSPSHFIPLATPGMISQGIKWMLSATSPFYIKPRLDLSLMQWGYNFWRSTSESKVKSSAIALNNLLQLSRGLTIEMKLDLSDSFDLQEKGVWMLWKNQTTGHHEIELAKDANKFGLNTIVCNGKEVQDYEKHVEIDVNGGVLYVDDCHLHPGKFMTSMVNYLKSNHVEFKSNTNITKFNLQSNKVHSYVTTDGDTIKCDEIVVANGSWMEATAAQLGIKLLMQPGKGYSMEYNDLESNLMYPSILVDDRVATTPIHNWLRIGGTMELSGHSNNILPKRVQAIHTAFHKYYPTLNLPSPDFEKVWYGYRPVTPDGMPYIGRSKSLENVSFAGGHAMLGVSGAAGTGKLIAEITADKKTSINLEGFNIDRF
jgi:D-amino-acid dehydrogenase